MNPLEHFMAYAAAFEKTYADDDWSRLERFLAEDAVYQVQGMPLIDCEIRGRENIFRGIRKSLQGFDRNFDSRDLRPVGQPEVEGRRVTIFGIMHYAKEGLPVLTLKADETAEMDAEGRIVLLRDVYAPDQHEAYEWFRRHGAGFDVSYV